MISLTLRAVVSFGRVDLFHTFIKLGTICPRALCFISDKSTNKTSITAIFLANRASMLSTLVVKDNQPKKRVVLSIFAYG